MEKSPISQTRNFTKVDQNNLKLMDIIKNSVYSEKKGKDKGEGKRLNSDIPSIMFTDNYFEITGTK